MLAGVTAGRPAVYEALFELLLFDVTNSLVSKLTPETLFPAVAEQISRVVTRDLAMLGLLDRTTGELVFSGLHYAGENPPILSEIRAQPDGLPSGEVLRTGKPFVSDLPDLERFPSPVFKRWSEAGFCSVCSIPWVSPNSTLGTLELARRASSPFTDEDVELLVQVARQIAVALYEETRCFSRRT